MSTGEIVAVLARKLTVPLEPVQTASSHDLLTFLARRLKDDALQLSEADIHAFRAEVQAVYDHYVTEKGLFDMALEYWQVSRNL